jgi:hypothetical protein
MNEVAVVDKGADWRRLKARVLLRNSISSSSRSMAPALPGTPLDSVSPRWRLVWQGAASGLHGATVAEWRVAPFPSACSSRRRANAPSRPAWRSSTSRPDRPFVTSTRLHPETESHCRSVYGPSTRCARGALLSRVYEYYERRSELGGASGAVGGAEAVRPRGSSRSRRPETRQDLVPMPERSPGRSPLPLRADVGGHPSRSAAVPINSVPHSPHPDSQGEPPKLKGTT